MSFEQYFIHHKDPHQIEDMYQAFKERMYHEAETGTDWDIWLETQEAADRQIDEEADEHYCKYLKSEYYREQWAIKQGYLFRPKDYNPQEKYR